MAAECGNGSPLRVCLEALRTGPLWGLDHSALGGVSPPGLHGSSDAERTCDRQGPSCQERRGRARGPALSLPVFCLLSDSFFSAPKPPIPT